MELRRIAECTWELPARGDMLVPGRIFASKSLMAKADEDRAVLQVENVAHLPGIVEASMAMPDIHWGYGFPIGGVAATAVDAGGVISPGGVGFDICCGVRLLASHYDEQDFNQRRTEVMDELDRCIPRGLGKGSIADAGLLHNVLRGGSPGNPGSRLRLGLRSRPVRGAGHLARSTARVPGGACLAARRRTAGLAGRR